MTEVRILAASGMLGTGFLEESLRLGLAMKPHMIGVDAGSTDSGPTDLATGSCRYSEDSYRRDLRLLLAAAIENDIPLIIGSAGGAGGDKNVEWARRILVDVAGQLGLSMRLAVIYSGQDKSWLKDRLAAGKSHPLADRPSLTDAVIDESLTIVGLMGVEPIQDALCAGANVVLAGRATDTSIFAALPLMLGANPGLTWHAAKILECGAAAVEHRPTPDCMFATIRDNELILEAPNPALVCTPTSIAAHSLYENADPFHVVEPSGVLDTTNAEYGAVDNRVVRVTGSEFVHADQYTIKLEGTRLAGYQTIVVAGVRDPVILERLDEYIDACQMGIAARIKQTFPDLAAADWSVRYRVYGRNGVLGDLEPESKAPNHEVGLIIEVTATTQALASKIASVARHQTLHQSSPGWKGFLSNIALPYGSNDLVRGPVYEFNMNVVVEPDSPQQMFRSEIVELTGALATTIGAK